MSREKHNHKKKQRKDATNENENKNKQPKSQLFSEADAKYAEVSDYTAAREVPQTEQWIQEHAIPTGVVDIDESVQLPIPPPKSDQQHHDTKPYTTRRPSENDHKDNVHLPPISHNSHDDYKHHPYEYYHPTSKHHPYEYYHASSNYHHFRHLSHPYPVYHEHHSSHHHHRHKHEKEVETYDPRWWYLPLNSVHRPKPWQPAQSHYVPSKWYELPSRQIKILMTTQESKPSPQKYVHCRCDVCRPSKETLRGIRWVVNE